MKKPAAPKPWAPVPVAVQIQRHNAALAAAKKKAAVAAAHPAVAQARHVAAVKAALTRAKSRKWSPDEDVAVCALRAVAAAQQLAVSDGELLAVYFSLTADADAGLTIGEAVAALPGPLRMPVLGVGWPEPHAVAVDPSGLWWSWGELHVPWTADVEEVWPAWRP